MEQPTLFEIPSSKTFKYDPDLKKQSKRNDPETSKEAVKKVDLKGHREYVKGLFRKHGMENGLTDFELEKLSELRVGGAQKRRSDLSRDGEIEWRGKHRPTDSGSLARVWHLRGEQ